MDSKNSEHFKFGCKADAILEKADVESQTDLTVFKLDEMDDCIKNITIELAELKKKVMEADFRENSFKNNPDKTKFYTGNLNFLILQQVLTLCSPYIYTGATKNSN